MIRWLATFAVVASGISVSCTDKTEPTIPAPLNGVAIQAQLLEFYDLGLKYNYDDRGEEYHLSVFVVLSPSSLCGAELVVAHSHLPVDIDDWPTIGFVYRLRVQEAQIDYLSMPIEQRNTSTFHYPRPPIVGNIGEGAPNVECF